LEEDLPKKFFEKFGTKKGNKKKLIFQGFLTVHFFFIKKIWRKTINWHAICCIYVRNKIKTKNL